MRSLLLNLAAALSLIAGTAPAWATEGRTTADVALRARPAGNAALLLTIPAGSTVDIGRCSGAWCRVAWSGTSGYATKRGLAVATATPAKGPVRGGVTLADGSQLWPILPPYPYRSGYYPKADWYFDIPPYVAIEPSFYRRRYFMMAQERNRYRYVPHVFRGEGADYDIDYGGDVDFSYKDIDMTSVGKDESN